MTPPQHLLLFQAGPVQEFIAQARSTRDCWSGSFLLSWLMAHAIQAVKKACPGASFIFPSLTSQPLLEYLDAGEDKRRRLAKANARAILTPNLPNLFCVMLPNDGSVSMATEAAVRVFSADATSPWKEIADRCLRTMGGLDNDRLALWNDQIARHWQVTWQAWPMFTGAELVKHAQTVPALKQPKFALSDYHQNYQIAAHRLAARRNTREFAAWQRTPLKHKDYFSGKEEAVADKDWLDKAREKDKLKYLFREKDELGAVNVIKRVWHKFYLDEIHGLKRQNLAFDSTPDVAAAPWRKMLGKSVLDSEPGNPVEIAFWHFVEAVGQARQTLDPELASLIPLKGKDSLGEWLESAGIALFNDSTWECAGDEPDHLKTSAVLQALHALREKAKLGNPGRYYAVIAMDGDEMGKWLAGDMTQCSLTQEQHQSLSAALSAFSTDKARLIVEDHCGTLVYAGGDDVLALLPATTVLTCAKALVDEFAKIIPFSGARNLTASAGISIGHFKAPLQDMITAAREAEHRAKHGLGRDAIAVTLYKRSGEMVQWGAKRSSTAWALLDLYQQHSRVPIEQPAKSMNISGRFPHRLAELLLLYGDGTHIDADLFKIIQREFDFILTRQVKDDHALRAQLSTEAAAFLAQLVADQYTVGDFLHLFTIEAFIARQGD